MPDRRSFLRCAFLTAPARRRDRPSIAGPNTYAWDVATDAAGNVVVLGSLSNTIDLGAGMLTSSGAADF